METGMNTGIPYRGVTKFITLYSQYLIKLKPHKTAHFEVNLHNTYLVTTRMSHQSITNTIVNCRLLVLQ